MEDKLSQSQKQKIKSFRGFLLRWGRNNSRSFSWRRTTNPYRVLISEVLLQRTNAKQAARQYSLFVKKYPNLASLKSVSTKEIKWFFAPLGLHKRTNVFMRMIKVINEKYGGKLPREYSLLVKLPGVGDYGANAILLFAFGERRGLVDANTIRIFANLFGKKISREEGKRSPFIKACAEYFSFLGRDPRKSNWLLLDYGAFALKR